jgi:uncharacterized protein YvpB
MKEEIFNIEKTTQMSDASFPIITLRSGKDELNLLHGYSNNLDANVVRESLTPLDNEQSFVAVIDEKENEVKRVIYELRSVKDNELIETNTINALEKEGDQKTAKIKFRTVLKEDLEYAVKITLVTSNSKKMNFYTRVKLLPKSYYKEKVDFVMNFHNSIMDKTKAKDIIIFLEPETGVDDSSLAHVNIHSSFDLISWGKLSPKVMGNIIPTIKEISPDMASIELKYMVSAETDNGTEVYYIKEFYRVRYTTSRMYLLNYERNMESAFDINLTSLSKSEFKIGITSQTDMDLVTSSDHNKLSFVRQRELWYYDLAEKSAVKVFSFRQENTDYVRDVFAEHDVRILNMDDDGNINFIVYGYMNRGVYEGRVGIVLYKFYSAENRIEELVYIPMNVPYQILKEQLGSFSYVNQLGTFYFTINDKIYAYSLITKELSVIVSGISSDDYVVSKDQHYIVWQDSSNPAEAVSINILDLETIEEKKITAPPGSNIKLLGKIENNIIYGYVKTKDITKSIDGSTIVPMYQIDIADAKLNILKEYSKAGYYVTDAEVNSNIITLERMVKKKQDGEIHYELTDPDSILNQINEKPQAINLTTRVTQKTLTELYISLTSGYTMESLPKVSDTINTVITEDTTLRLEEEVLPVQYIVYALGGIEGIYDNAGDAINQADALVGTVLNNEQSIVWERGIKDAMTEISGITPIYESGNTDSVMACARMLINYFKGYTNNNSSSMQADSVRDLLNKGLDDSLLNLTGCTLDEVLYYISKNRPILAMKDSDNAVLIVGYDAYNITVIDPSSNTTKKIGLNDGMEMFKSAGNIFISYITKE